MFKFNLNFRSGRWAFIGLMILATIFLMTALIGATIINVPGDYPTIQDGINAAVDYDTVLVAPGHYIENVNFNGKDIVLTSHFMYDQNTDYIFNTIIDGGNQAHPDTGTAVLLVNYEGSAAILQGFSITGGTGTLYQWSPGQYDRKGGGVFLLNSTATVQYNYIHDNHCVNNTGIHAAGGGGIQVLNENPTIKNNIIVHNEAKFGAGLSMGHCTGVVKNNVIAYNYGGSIYSGSGIHKNVGGATLIENNTFFGNSSPLQGAAIKVVTATPTIRNNIFWHNEGPTPQVDVDNQSIVTYCNIEEEFFTATGNIHIEPHLNMNDWLYPYDDSPEIDAGDPGTAYNDIENPGAAGSANWPSFGTLRNDIGAYGGPGAFPFHQAAIYADTSVGWIPLTVSFEAYSAQDVVNWIWDFADGGSDNIRNPSHIFEVPGQHEVTLKAVTPSDDTLTDSYSIYILADTIKTDDIEVTITGSNELEVIVNLTNYAPVKNIILPVEYSGGLDLEYVSYYTTGCRTESYTGIELTVDAPSKTLLFDIKSQMESPDYLPAGNGPVLVIVFNLVDWIVGATTISFDGYDTTEPKLTGDGFEYVPDVVDGVVTTSYRCGDANGDELINIGDVVYLVNLVFHNGPMPKPEAAGDVNCDGNVNIGDAVYLGNYVFRPGSPIPCAACL